MKLTELNGTYAGTPAFYREGGSHSVWINPQTGKIASVPRHREIKGGTVRDICKQLEIPRP